MAVPSVQPNETKDRTILDGIIVAAVILGIAGVFIVGRQTVEGDRAEASERTTPTSLPPAIDEPATNLWAQPQLNAEGLPQLTVTIQREHRDLIGATIAVDGAPCEVGVSVRAGGVKEIACPVPASSSSATVRVTDERGTDESLVVPLTVGPSS